MHTVRSSSYSTTTNSIRTLSIFSNSKPQQPQQQYQPQVQQQYQQPVNTNRGNLPPRPNDNDDRYESDRERDEREAREDRERARDRDERDRERKRRRGRGCGEDCEEDCRVIFNSRDEREDCQRLSEDEVEALYAAVEILENPDDDSLADVNLEDLENLMSIDNEQLLNYIKSYSDRENVDFLLWLLSDDEILNLVVDEDEDFKYLDELLENIESEGHIEALGDDGFYSDDSLLKVVEDNGEEDAMDWVNELLIDEDCPDSDNQDACLLEKYCEIVKDNGDDKDNGYALLQDLAKEFSLFRSIVEKAAEGHFNTVSSNTCTTVNDAVIDPKKLIGANYKTICTTTCGSWK